MITEHETGMKRRGLIMAEHEIIINRLDESQ